MISNATAVICLSKINRLELLKKAYSSVLIPLAVKNEVLLEGREGYQAINNAIKKGWLKVIEPKKTLDLGLGTGENHAISLAKERKDIIILDDAVAITAAKSLNINHIRTTTVVFVALKKKIINKKQATLILNQLIEEGYYISPQYYAGLIAKLK